MTLDYTIYDLDLDILYMVCTYLDIKDIYLLSFTSKYFYDFLYNIRSITISRLSDLDIIHYGIISEIDIRQLDIESILMYGTTQCIVHYIKKGLIDPGKGLIYSARRNNLEIVIWIHYTYSQLKTGYSVDEAAKYGSFEAMKWLYHNRYDELSHNALDEAASAGHLRIVKWLYLMHYKVILDKQCKAIGLEDIVLDDDEPRSESSRSDRLYICKKIYTSNAIDNAACNGHLRIVKWLTYMGCEASIWAMNYAAANGHLEVVIFLYRNRLDGYTDYALNHAAANGHLEVVKYLTLVVGMTGISTAINYARDNQRDNVVQYLMGIAHV